MLVVVGTPWESVEVNSKPLALSRSEDKDGEVAAAETFVVVSELCEAGCESFVAIEEGDCTGADGVKEKAVVYPSVAPDAPAEDPRSIELIVAGFAAEGAFVGVVDAAAVDI